MRSLTVCALLCLLAAAPAAAQDGLPVDVRTQRSMGTITGEGVYVRRGPGTEHGYFAQFGRGNRVRVLGSEGNWVHVAFQSSGGEERGYVFGRYVRLDGAAPTGGSTGGIDLPQKVADYLAVVRDPARFHPGNAAELMNREFQALDSLNPAAVDYSSIDRDTDRLLRDLFDLTLMLDEKMVEFELKGQLTVPIIEGKRRAMRGLRFLREQVMMRQAQNGVLPYKHGKPMLAHQMQKFPYQWVANPAYERLPLSEYPRTFFLLNVGNSTVSGAIARSTSVDTMFSHFSIGYRLEQDAEVDGKRFKAGDLVTIEALIEAGVVIKPFASHFESSTREVIFFARDESKQAALDQAAQRMFDRAVAAINGGNAIGYDFSMGHQGLANAVSGQPAFGERDLINATNYFCAGVADAVGEAADINVFPHRSKLEQGSNSAALFRSWGMNPSLRVPAPGDADVSTTLVRVAEATAVAKMTESHLMHATLKSMFEWMDTDGYRLRQPGWFKAGSWVVGGLNADSFNLGFVPAGIDTDIMRSFASVHKAASAYHEALTRQNELFRERNGRDLTPREAQSILRQLRDRDMVPAARAWFRR